MLNFIKKIVAEDEIDDSFIVFLAYELFGEHYRELPGIIVNSWIDLLSRKINDQKLVPYLDSFIL